MTASIRSRLCQSASIGLLAATISGAALAQQTTTPDPDELMRMMQAGQMPGSPLQTQDGTWLYPVASGLHEGLLGDREIGSGNGIDGDFMARSSLQAVYTAAAATCGAAHASSRWKSGRDQAPSSRKTR